MSMLAERKRKQKWSLNPRGKDWAQDTNKFGQKLMEKMGWSHGKGLGAKENGRTEHIKVAYKNDSQGMGYKESDEQWTEHESNFSALLSALGGGEAPKNDEIKLSSLEEKSQNSKARVHYKKFTRGKDLSKYSEKDLANIFGKKSLKEMKKAKQQELEANKQEINEAIEQDKNFSNAGLMSDYFKKKAPNFGKTNGYEIGNNGVLRKADDSESESDVRPSFGFGFNQNSTKSCETETTTSFGLTSFTQNKENHIKSTFISYVNETEEMTPKKDKKKRTLKDDGTNLEDTPSKKKKLDASIETPTKKKKDKSKKKQSEEAGLSNPAFDPLYTPNKIEKHVLEPINESIDASLNDTVGQVAENFKIQVHIDNEVTPVKRKGESDGENVLKKKKKKKDKANEMDISYQNEDTGQTAIEDSTVQSKKKKKKSKSTEEMDTSTLNETADTLNNSKAEKKKQKIKANSIESINSTIPDDVEQEKVKKKKSKPEGIDNPFFNMSMEHESSTVDSENPFEVKPKQKKKKKRDKNKDNSGVENPVFNGEDSVNSQDILDEEFEVKRKSKKEKKGLDNPALNLNDTIEESCDLMLNIVSTPIQTSQNKTISEDSLSIKQVKGVIARRKSVRFSDVTRERIIPPKEEIESETLDESRDILELEGKLNDSSDLSFIDKFIQKKKAKKAKKNKGLDNGAFDQQANSIEENITSISKTLDTYQAEIENDINEAKIKSVEIEDIMVGEVGNPEGPNEKLPDGSVKLKFKYANFRRTTNYVQSLTGAKKSYKHLIKGDIVMGFKESNLHEIDGYAVAKA